MRQKMFSFADSFQIKDETGRDAFVVSGKVFSLGKQLSFQDLDGSPLLSIKQQLMSFKPTYEILKGDDPIAVVKKDLFSVFSYRFSIEMAEGTIMEATGNFLDHEYAISREGNPVASISKQWFTVSDTYGVDIGDGEDDIFLLAVTVVVDMVCHPDHR